MTILLFGASHYRALRRIAEYAGDHGHVCVVETAKENGVNPTAYLTYLFERTSTMDVADEAAFETLLPWSETLTEGIRVKK